MENSTGSNLATRNNFSVFAKPDLKGIVLIGKPNMYMADCSSVGQFKNKKQEYLGKELKMEILNVTKIAGKFFTYDPQMWLELLFVDGNNRVSTCLFKTQSLDNFYECLTDILSSGKALGEVIVTGKMVTRDSKKNNSKYSAVEFSYTDNKPERVKELSEWLDANIDVLDYSLLCEMSNRGEHVDTNTGEDLEYSQEIKENGNMGTKTDGFGMEIKN